MLFPMQRTNDLGKGIRDLRERAGMTIGDVAREAGISPTYLSNVENGKREPRSEWVGRVVTAIADRLTGAASSSHAA
ncbi:helix-turn-helix domain-containing protein [Streptomyces sp. NPDC058171]